MVDGPDGSRFQAAALPAGWLYGSQRCCLYRKISGVRKLLSGFFGKSLFVQNLELRQSFEAMNSASCVLVSAKSTKQRGEGWVVHQQHRIIISSAPSLFHSSTKIRTARSEEELNFQILCSRVIPSVFCDIRFCPTSSVLKLSLRSRHREYKDEIKSRCSA